MKKVFKAAFYLAWFAVPGLIVQYYSRNIDPMSPEEVRMATIAGTVAMIVLAILTGFGRTARRAAQPPVPKPSGKVKMPPVPKTPVPPVVTVPPRTRIIRDPATGAERIYEWNDSTGQWETDGGRTVLDDSRMGEWISQRENDRRWADDQMTKLRNRDTAFDRDMDDLGRRQQRELEEMERQMEKSRKFGEKHGKWDLTEQERRDYLDQKYARDLAEGAKWQEAGDYYDSIVNKLEWTQWGADFAMDILDISTFGAGKPIKYAYIASRNLAGDLMDGLLHRRSLSGIMTRTVTKTVIDIGQDNVSKIGYKYVSNGVGDGIKEAIQYYDEGKSASDGFVSGFVKGTTRTGVEHGLSKVKLKWNSKQNEIAKKATQQSSKLLGQQQSGQISQKLSTALRNNIRTDAAQKIAAETAKQKDLLSTSIGKLTDGAWNMALE